MKALIPFLSLLSLLAGSPTAFGQSLNSFAPGTGAPGAVVTLTGTNLTSALDVSFGGVPTLSFTVTSATTISAVVPQQAATGKITVTLPSTTLQSASDFSVLVPSSSLPTGPVTGVSLLTSDSPFTLFNNHLFFSRLQSGNTQLWRSDGTAAGTINVSNSIRTPVNVAYALASERYLYFYERATAGTKLVALDGALTRRDLSTTSSINDAYALLNQKVIFERDLGVWVFDELTATSRLLLNFLPHLVVSHRGLAYFKGNPGSGGYGIGRTDGTVAGTFLLSSSSSLYANQFGGAGEYMYIVTSTPTSSAATLYRTKGEASNPLTPISGFVGDIRYLTDVNGTLFFLGRASSGATGWELYKVNNTTAELVVDLAPGTGSGVRESVMPVAIGNTIYFTGQTSQGIELWKSNGTATGTVLVKDLNPGTGDAYPDYLTAVGNRVFFTGGTSFTDRRLHVSDGTAAGTQAVSYPSGGIIYLRYFRGMLVFSANTVNTNGRDLHLYNLAGLATATAQPWSASGFTMYPNPATDYITIQPAASPARWNGTLYNQLGQKLTELRFEPAAPLKVDMRKFPSGIYQLHVENGREHYTGKIVKP